MSARTTCVTLAACALAAGCGSSTTSSSAKGGPDHGNAIIIPDTGPGQGDDGGVDATVPDPGPDGPACEQVCEGKDCGDDGCGGTCGACTPSTTCKEGKCVPACVPACEGKACGPDGCEGICGQCDVGDECKDGECVPPCVPNCANKECGADGCGGECGECPAGSECSPLDECEPVCVPQCAFKECGDDQCGGTCGKCAAEGQCVSGVCIQGDPDSCAGKCGGTLPAWPCQCDPACFSAGTCCADVCAFCEGAGAALAVKCAKSCAPYCKAGWECGSDGCGGACGFCSGGDACNPGTRKCEAKPKSSGALGDYCGQTPGCLPKLPDGSDNPLWPACLNEQCKGGYCFDPVCVVPCTLLKDVVDWEGNPGADGVQDADMPSLDCKGAVDGPKGTSFNCVAVIPEVALCVPGTSFAKCSSDADCPSGETCQLQYILGEYTARCATPPKGGGKVGAFCNQDPTVGEVAMCESDLCVGVGCLAFCLGDSDCNTSALGCTGGTCGADPTKACEKDADCSAFQCKAGHALLGDPAKGLFDVCLPKSCNASGDCPKGTFCAISWNGKTGPEKEWAHICVAAAPYAAKLGEACDTGAFDAEVLPPCAGPCLTSGKCSAICESDADCPGDAFLCQAIEVGVDYEEDGADDKQLALGLCMGFEGTQAPCSKEADCKQEAESCEFLSFVDPATGKYDGKGLCSLDGEGEGGTGALCGGLSPVLCKGSGYCIGASETEPGYCTELCAGKADCPQNVVVAGLEGELPMVCRAFRVMQSLTLDVVDDDVWAPLCVAAGAGSTLSDCAEAKQCEGASQACYAHPIVVGAAGPATVEYLCVSNLDGDGKVPAGLPGDPCTVDAQCAGLYCLNAGAPTGGYCSALCTAGSGCPAGMSCGNVLLVDRPGTEDDVTVMLCVK